MTWFFFYVQYFLNSLRFCYSFSVHNFSISPANVHNISNDFIYVYCVCASRRRSWRRFLPFLTAAAVLDRLVRSYLTTPKNEKKIFLKIKIHYSLSGRFRRSVIVLTYTTCWNSDKRFRLFICNTSYEKTRSSLRNVQWIYESLIIITFQFSGRSIFFTTRYLPP